MQPSMHSGGDMFVPSVNSSMSPEGGDAAISATTSATNHSNSNNNNNGSVAHPDVGGFSPFQHGFLSFDPVAALHQAHQQHHYQHPFQSVTKTYSAAPQQPSSSSNGNTLQGHRLHGDATSLSASGTATMVSNSPHSTTHGDDRGLAAAKASGLHYSLFAPTAGDIFSSPSSGGPQLQGVASSSGSPQLQSQPSQQHQGNNQPLPLPQHPMGSSMSFHSTSSSLGGSSSLHRSGVAAGDMGGVNFGSAFGSYLAAQQPAPHQPQQISHVDLLAQLAAAPRTSPQPPSSLLMQPPSLVTPPQHQPHQQVLGLGLGDMMAASVSNGAESSSVAFVAIPRPDGTTLFLPTTASPSNSNQFGSMQQQQASAPSHPQKYPTQQLGASGSNAPLTLGASADPFEENFNVLSEDKRLMLSIPVSLIETTIGAQKYLQQGNSAFYTFRFQLCRSYRQSGKCVHRHQCAFIHSRHVVEPSLAALVKETSVHQSVPVADLEHALFPRHKEPVVLHIYDATAQRNLDVDATHLYITHGSQAAVNAAMQDHASTSVSTQGAAAACASASTEMATGTGNPVSSSTPSSSAIAMPITAASVSAASGGASLAATVRLQLCQHFDKGLCARGASCNFVHRIHLLQPNPNASQGASQGAAGVNQTVDAGNGGPLPSNHRSSGTPQMSAPAPAHLGFADAPSPSTLPVLRPPSVLPPQLLAPFHQGTGPIGANSGGAAGPGGIGIGGTGGTANGNGNGNGSAATGGPMTAMPTGSMLQTMYPPTPATASHAAAGSGIGLGSMGGGFGSQSYYNPLAMTHPPMPTAAAHSASAAASTGFHLASLLQQQQQLQQAAAINQASIAAAIVAAVGGSVPQGMDPVSLQLQTALAAAAGIRAASSASAVGAAGPPSLHHLAPLHGPIPHGNTQHLSASASAAGGAGAPAGAHPMSQSFPGAMLMHHGAHGMHPHPGSLQQSHNALLSDPNLMHAYLAAALQQQQHSQQHHALFPHAHAHHHHGVGGFYGGPAAAMTSAVHSREAQGDASGVGGAVTSFMLP